MISIRTLLECYLGSLHRHCRCQCGNGGHSMVLADTSQAEHTERNEGTAAPDRRTGR